MLRHFVSSLPSVARDVKDRCLILTVKGGGGHLQAAKSKEAELSKDFPGTHIATIDVMVEWGKYFLGGVFSEMWNRAQRKGDLVFLEMSVRGQPIIDTFLWLPVFISAVYTLKKHEINWVIDTQNMTMSAIIKAIRFVQYWTKKEIVYEKVLTDLPTEKATHFFNPIKRLCKKDRKQIRLITTKPLLSDKESEEVFWNKTCKLPLSSVQYTALPLRPSFQNRKSSPTKAPLTLEFQTTQPQQRDLIRKALATGSIPIQWKDDRFQITMTPEVVVSTIMLGSHPHGKAILEYTKQFIDVAKTHQDSTKNTLLFIFCSEALTSKCTLMKQIVSLIQKEANFAPTLTIIPLPYQNDTVIAPLYERSDVTVTRSGGMTSMELLTLSNGQILIHKQDPPRFLSPLCKAFETIREGMPPWEWGNAEYLREKKGARFVSPHLLSPIYAEIISSL